MGVKNIIDKKIIRCLKSIFASDGGDYKYGISIAAIIRDEGEYIREWLTYHKLAGIEHVYLMNNESTDGIAEIIRDFTESGFVDLIDFPGNAVQIEAYNYVIKNFKNENKYIAFIDADEFLFPMKQGEKLLDVIERIMSKDKKAGGVAVNWRVFGSSGFEKKPEGGVLESFVHRAFEDGPGNVCIKTIVNPRRVFKWYHVHYPVYMCGFYSIDENGNIVEGWQNELSEIKELRINHYFCKSKEEWIKRRSRGRATIKDGKQKYRTIEEFNQHDKNDIFDDSMLYYVEMMKNVQV